MGEDVPHSKGVSRMWKVLRINVKTNTIEEELLNEDYALLGGRSLVAQFLTDEVDPKCDPLGPENKLVMCTGVLAGTSISAAHRLSIGAKSPLTGGIKESSAGGTAGTLMTGHGIKMMVFEDVPNSHEFKILHIDKNGTSSLIPADDYCGLNNYATAEKALEEFGEDSSVMSIGVGGERHYLSSGIAVSEFRTGTPCRFAARGGLGAVLGSKGIKAIVIEKSAARYKLSVAHEAEYDAARKELTEALVEASAASPFANVGTAAIVALTGPSAVMPYRNFSGDVSPSWQEIGPGVFMGNLAAGGGKNKIPCQLGCIAHCSNHYNSKNGDPITSALEYETIALCGPNLDIFDFDTIAAIDRFCDDFGLDSLEVGCALGVCMDVDTIPWGDAEGVFKLLEEISNGTELGSMIGQGAQSCGTYLGAKRIPTVKGQAMPAYDPRNLKGTGITYATSAMGADHTAGVTIGQPVDHLAKDGQVELSRQAQVKSAVGDCFLCNLTWNPAFARLDLVARVYGAIHGNEITSEALLGMGEKILQLEFEFNKAAGFIAKDDDLPEFFKNEASAFTGAIWDLSTEEMQAIHSR